MTWLTIGCTIPPPATSKRVCIKFVYTPIQILHLIFSSFFIFLPFLANLHLYFFSSSSLITRACSFSFNTRHLRVTQHSGSSTILKVDLDLISPNEVCQEEEDYPNFIRGTFIYLFIYWSIRVYLFFNWLMWDS